MAMNLMLSKPMNQGDSSAEAKVVPAEMLERRWLAVELPAVYSSGIVDLDTEVYVYQDLRIDLDHTE